MKRLICIGLVAALSVATVHAAEDSGPSPETQARASIETRQGLFKLVGFSWGPIAGMLRNRVPFDANVVAKGSQRVEQLAGLIPDVFASDTRKLTETKTAALDGIWASQADFNAKADNLAKAARELTAAAKTGDKDATLKAAQGVGKACSACHDDYRLKK